MDSITISDGHLIDQILYLKDVEPEAKRVLSQSCLKYYDAGRLLYTPHELSADTCYLNMTGIVQLTSKHNGLSFFCGQASLIGFDSVMSGGAYNETAEVCTPTFMYALNGQWLRELVEKYPLLRQASSQHAQQQRSQVEAHFADMFFGNKKSRLAVTLKQFSEALSSIISADSVQPYPCEFGVWQTLEEIGAGIDSCRITVAQSLRYLHEQGAIRYLPRKGSRPLRIILDADSGSRIEEALRKIS